MFCMMPYTELHDYSAMCHYWHCYFFDLRGQKATKVLIMLPKKMCLLFDAQNYASMHNPG